MKKTEKVALMECQPSWWWVYQLQNKKNIRNSYVFYPYVIKYHKKEIYQKINRSIILQCYVIFCKIQFALNNVWNHQISFIDNQNHSGIYKCHSVHIFISQRVCVWGRGIPKDMLKYMIFGYPCREIVKVHLVENPLENLQLRETTSWRNLYGFIQWKGNVTDTSDITYGQTEKCPRENIPGKSRGMRFGVSSLGMS